MDKSFIYIVDAFRNAGYQHRNPYRINSCIHRYKRETHGHKDGQYKKATSKIKTNEATKLKIRKRERGKSVTKYEILHTDTLTDPHTRTDIIERHSHTGTQIKTDAARNLSGHLSSIKAIRDFDKF